MGEHTIRAADLALVLASFKLSRHTQGKAPTLAAMTAAPVVQVDCAAGRNPRVYSPAFYCEAVAVARTGKQRPGVAPMTRGTVAMLIERVAREGGRKELLRTFGAGISELRREPRHTLRRAGS